MAAITGISIFGKMSVGVRESQAADQENEQRENDESVRAGKSDSDYPHIY